MDHSPLEHVLSSKLGNLGCWEGIESGAELVPLLLRAETVRNVWRKLLEQSVLCSGWVASAVALSLYLTKQQAQASLPGQWGFQLDTGMRRSCNREQ